MKSADYCPPANTVSSIFNRPLVQGFLILILLLTIPSASAKNPAPGQITLVSQLQNLPATPADADRPLQITGVVVCCDAGWHQLYLYDGHNTGYFDADDFPNLPVKGQTVEITGVAHGTNLLANLRLTVLGSTALPSAVPLAISQLDQDHGEWVQTEGRVMSAEATRGRLALLLHDTRRNAIIYLLGSALTNDFQKLLGCRVRVRGINASKSVDGHLDTPMLFAPGLDEVTILTPPAQSPPAPVVSISSLQNRELGAWTNDWVHISGLVVAYEPGQSLVVKDPTGVMRARVIQLTEIPEDERVDVWGFLEVSGEETFLNHAYFEVAQPEAEEAAVSLGANLKDTPARLAETITSMSEIHKMRREEAARHLPVRVRGVLTYADPAWRNGFIQDKSDALYVDLEPSQKDLQPGQWVELTGQTGAGGFAPEVEHSQIRVLGLTNLPVPARVDMEDLANGHWDAHWVAMEGVVRHVDDQSDHVSLSVMTPDGRFRVIIPKHDYQPAPPLIDALVSVRGACTSELNARRQLSGITLHTPGFDQIQILEPPPADPFAIETTKIALVGTFDPDRLAVRRVKIQGVVTLPLRDRGFYLQDDTGGILVQTLQTDDVHIGDSVSVLGFPAIGNFSPVLEEASFRPTASQPAPTPNWTTAEQILLHGTNDAQVVELEARLLQNVPRSAHPQLVLQEGPIIFNASFEAQAGRSEAPALVSGSLLRLKGICSIQGDERHEPVTFSLLISRLSDIEVRETPAWWTARHALMVAASLAIAVAVSLAWVGLLRRQVSHQTQVIRHQLKEAEALEKEILEISNREQRRIGHDLHDGVCQQLAGIALLTSSLADELESHHAGSAAAEAERISTLLNDAIEQTRGVARGLFPVHLEEKGLVSALEELAANASDLFKINCQFIATHPPKTIEKGIALHLYYIVLEAVANASKHGSARKVVIKLKPDGKNYGLSVQDDGVGFVRPPGGHTGMGIRIMEYRARVIEATLTLQSQPGSGTRVICLFVPVSNETRPVNGLPGKQHGLIRGEKISS